MATVIPEILLQRQTSILLGSGQNIQLIVRRTPIRGILNPIRLRTVDNAIKEGVRIVQQRLRLRIRFSKTLPMRFKRTVPPPHLLFIRPWIYQFLIRGGPVQRWQIDEQKVAVSGIVHRLHALFKHSGHELFPELFKRHAAKLLDAVIHVVDPDPYCHQRAAFVHLLPNYRLRPCQVLLCLVHQWHRVIVMQRQELLRYVGARECEIPELDTAGRRARAIFKPAAC